MKRTKIYMTGVICIAAGAVMLVGSFLTGGRPGFTIDLKGIHLEGSGEDDYIQEKTSLEEFSSAEISLDYCDLMIVASDEFAIEYALYGSGAEPVAEVKNHKLVIQEKPESAPAQIRIFSWGVPDIKQNYVKLYVPEETALTSLGIRSESGDISIEGLQAETVNCAASYGNVEIKNLECEKAELVVESGDFSADILRVQQMELRNDYGDIDIGDLNAEKGSITLESGDLEVKKLTAGSLEVENAYGDAELKIGDGISGYSMELTTEYGDISAPDKGSLISDGGEARYYVSGEENKEIRVFCESGDIRIH